MPTSIDFTDTPPIASGFFHGSAATNSKNFLPMPCFSSYPQIWRDCRSLCSTPWAPAFASSPATFQRIANWSTAPALRSAAAMSKTWNASYRCWLEIRRLAVPPLQRQKQRIRDHYLWSDIACRIEAAYLKLTEQPRVRKKTDGCLESGHPRVNPCGRSFGRDSTRHRNRARHRTPHCYGSRDFIEPFSLRSSRCFARFAVKISRTHVKSNHTSCESLSSAPPDWSATPLCANLHRLHRRTQF